MKTMAISAIAAASFATLAAVSGAALAVSGTDDDQVDIQALSAMKIGFVEAIQAAENDQHGRASAASFANRAGGGAYEVHLVMSDGAMKSVIVDGRTGQVTADPGDAAENETGDEPEDAE